MNTSTESTIKPIKVGDRIKNGSTVLAIGGFRPGGGGCVSSAVVLALSGQEFVTWDLSLVDLSAFTGHYHRDLAEALADFQARVGRR